MTFRNGTSRSGQLLLASVLALAAAVGLAGNVAHGQEPSEVRVFPATERLSVARVDTSFEFSARLPDACIGSTVTAALFARGGAATANERLNLTGTATVETPANGIVFATLPVPSELPPALLEAWPGFFGDCMDRPVISTEAGLLFGELDGSNVATFVIPADATTDEAGGPRIRVPITFFVDGQECRTVQWDDATLRDQAGNVRVVLGSADQPEACRREGGIVTFRYPDGNPSFEQRELRIGVAQPWGNLAFAVGESTGAPAQPPGPPQTGDVFLPAQSPGNGFGIARVVAVALVAVAAVATAVIARRRMST